MRFLVALALCGGQLAMADSLKSNKKFTEGDALEALRENPYVLPRNSAWLKNGC